jgi:flagellin-like hook-associated protein FlgL
MQLTNYSFLDSRENYISSLSQQRIASDRVSTGNRFENAGTDVGALGQNARLRSERLQIQSKRVAMQNFNTFLDTQQKTLQQVRGIYERMSNLAHQALDPTLTESSSGKRSDKDLLNTEFNVLASELDSILDRKVNGQLLFGGVSADFTEGVTDDDLLTLTPYKTTVDVGTTSGTMTIKFSTGRAPDQIFLFQGELPDSLNSYFDASSYSGNDNDDRDRLIELQDELYDQFEDQGIFTTGPWATPGAAKEIDETKLETDPLGNNHSMIQRNHDTFEIKFNSCEIDVTKKFDVDNNSARWGTNPQTTAESDKYGQEQYDELKNLGLLKERSPDGDSTLLTMVGLNYNKAGKNANKAIYEIDAKFTPSLPYNDIAVPSTGDVYKAISFGKIECSNINNSEKALKVLSNLDAEIANLTNSMAQVASSMQRCESEINHMENTDVFNETALGRISDTDYAKESTQLAKESIRMGLATQVMSNTTRLNDVLIPLTTNHFRSSVLSATL